MKDEVIFHQQRPDALWPSDFLTCSPGWAGYQLAHPGDSIDLSYATQNSRRGRVGTQVAHTLTTSETQAAGLSDSRLYKMAGNAVSVPVISALGRELKRIYEGRDRT